MSLAGGAIHSDGSLFLNAPITLNVGSDPISLVAADVDGDNKIDLITSNYGDGTLTLTGNQPLTVTGTPTLVLNDGGSATYVSGSGTPNLVFRYTIVQGQNTANLAVTGVTLPSLATIKDAAGNNAIPTGANATFTGLQVDTTAPVVKSIAISPGQSLEARSR